MRTLIFRITWIIILLLTNQHTYSQTINTKTLLEEMVDLDRLAMMPDINYKTIQFSSYDRRSTLPFSPGWFENSDGFGNEPIPGFEKVLKEPDKDGVGEYLLCDIKGPGAIVRTWTASFAGNIKVFLDDSDTPLYDGEAYSFMRNIYSSLLTNNSEPDYQDSFNQYDASYFPVSFAKSCRIVWTGKITDAHFYHLEVRLYEDETKVQTFELNDLTMYKGIIKLVTEKMLDPDKNLLTPETTKTLKFHKEIEAGKNVLLLSAKETGAICKFQISLKASDIMRGLKQSILKIYFDGAPRAQVQAPLGDFFGAAPGINPYTSLPFTVTYDGQMICRFIMPYRDSVRVELENLSDKSIIVIGEGQIKDYSWDNDKSLHFRARWRVNNDLTASATLAEDLPYLLAFGKGRVVGAAAYLYNPARAPSSHGNWWGEGDEKIFVDNDNFPSFFGTGTEDYFNYSWSSDRIFSFPYCGQTRNDGPGNRGFVSNYRWHIIDDILFNNNIGFYIELLHHDEVPGFSYGRLVYYYATPGTYDDHVPITRQDLKFPEQDKQWKPVGVHFSRNAVFYEPEVLIQTDPEHLLVKGSAWSEGQLFIWLPKSNNETLEIPLPIDEDAKYRIVITMAEMPNSGTFSATLNKKQQIAKQVSLDAPYYSKSNVYRSDLVELKKSDNNTITINLDNIEKGKNIGIDFIWIMKNPLY